MAQSGTTPEIEIPGTKDEKLPFGRVGIIAAVGFVLGIAWPRLAGVALVPSAPLNDEGRSPSAAASASEGPLATDAPTLAPSEHAEASEDVSADERILIGKMRVTSCQDAEGRIERDCDEPDLSAVAAPRLSALVGCDGAEGLTRGTLSIGFDLDFKKNKVSHLQRGQSTTLVRSRTEKLLACAENEFATASLEGVKHQHAKYTVFYGLDFLPPKPTTPEPTTPEPVEAVAASGRATVGWEVALIRDEPERDSKVIARVLRGTRVAVTSRQGDWYRVKYDARGHQGWVFRTAIGL